MATGGNPSQIQVNLDVQRLADTITNSNDLFVLIPNRYEGDPRKFQEWIKQIEKYAFTTELDGAKVKLIAYKTSAGPISDFIQRCITNNPNNTWNQLKAELTMRFAEISDSDQVLIMLREIKQYRDENVQCYAERLLSLASFVCFCCFTSQVNSYGHCGMVSSLNHTFSWAGLNKRLTSNLCAYFRS